MPWVFITFLMLLSYLQPQKGLSLCSIGATNCGDTVNIASTILLVSTRQIHNTVYVILVSKLHFQNQTSNEMPGQNSLVAKVIFYKLYEHQKNYKHWTALSKLTFPNCVAGPQRSHNWDTWRVKLLIYNHAKANTQKWRTAFSRKEI